MDLAEHYAKAHSSIGGYLCEYRGEGCTSYTHPNGWVDREVGRSMIFSHRNTVYETRESFTEGLHAHEYYEMLFYVSGDVEYIIDNTLIKPEPFTFIWFEPGQMHTARLITPSVYERYVMYFTPDFFECEGKRVQMLGFMKDGQTPAARFDGALAEEVYGCLKRASSASKKKHGYSALLTKSYLTELFGLLNTADGVSFAADEYTEDIAKVKSYIDREYASITTTEEIASRFFYSREHLSRKFKSRFNVSISDYIAKRRVTESLALLPKMSVAEASYSVGFRSQSSYIAAFVKNVGCLPSEYKRGR